GRSPGAQPSRGVAPPAAPLPAVRAGSAARSPPRATAPAPPAALRARRGPPRGPPRHRHATSRATRRAARSDETEAVDFSLRYERCSEFGDYAKITGTVAATPPSESQRSLHGRTSVQARGRHALAAMARPGSVRPARAPTLPP